MAKHKFWGAGEPNCPPELKAPNGELHTLRCKVCGDSWRESLDVCVITIPVVAQLRVFDVQADGEGTERHYVAETRFPDGKQLSPGTYRLVIHPADVRE